MSDPEQELNGPKGGFNIKVFMILVVVSTVVLVIVFYFFLDAMGSKDVPKANHPHPNARLQVMENVRLS